MTPTQPSPEVDAFIEWARIDRVRSPHTLIRYEAVLRQIPDPIAAGREDFEAWWATRLHLSPATRANELGCWRAFYRWAVRFDLRADDPSRRVDPPKIPNAVPRMIGREDFHNLLGEWTADAPDLRRAYALGGFGGLRVSEAADLEWANIDIEARRIFLRGKGNKERPVPINGLLLDHLLPERTGNVVTAGGRPYTGASLQRKINRHMARHGVDHTYHDLRKRGASILLAKGVSVAVVRVMFGWSSMETVARYAVVGDDQLDQAAALLD